MRRAITLSLILALAPCVVTAFEACSSFTGSVASTPDGSVALNDDSATSADGSAITQGDGGVPITYTASLSDVTAWSAFDVGTFVGNVGGGFHSGAFDGKYLYFTPALGGNFARYDTTRDLTASDAWQTHDLQHPQTEWIGGAFDGRYYVASPYFVEATGYANLLARFDTTGDFDDGGAWLTQALDGYGLFGVGRATKHLYFSPIYMSNVGVYANESADAGVDFFPTGQDESFAGGVFANGAYYFAPYYNAGPTGAGRVVRADEDGDGGEAGIELDSFDYATVANDPTARGYRGAVFDGHYVYFVPYLNYSGSGYQGTVLRYDTTRAFSDVASWTTFSIPTILGMPSAIGYAGGVFDGKYVYFAPNYSAASTPNTSLVRVDTTQDFAEKTSWEIFDMTQIAKSAGGYEGALFDGEYIYFVPAGTTVLLRFDARTPKTAPTIFPGSP